MTLEIIIIAIFASAAMLAAVLAVHNIRELHDTRIRRDEAEERNYSLELENEGLVRRIDELKLELNAEQKNRKALQAGNFCNIECFGGLLGYGGDIAKLSI